MKKFLVKVLIVTMMICTFACKKEEKKPFGAADFSYDDVEGINKDGPTLATDHPENQAPFSDKIYVENGPWHKEDAPLDLPTADFDPFAKDNDAPIYVPEHK